MNARFLAFALLAASGVTASLAAPAAAQQVYPEPTYGRPVYRDAPPAWDRFDYRRNELVGTISAFQPFRLQLARPDGRVQTIDLKNGTVILPTGTTPMVNERVAINGYYSNGTFIATRVQIRP